jgi:hypothetical protein
VLEKLGDLLAPRFTHEGNETDRARTEVKGRFDLPFDARTDGYHRAFLGVHELCFY